MYYEEFEDILNTVECGDLISMTTLYLDSPDGMFNRVFAINNEDLSKIISSRLTSKGYDMTDKIISKTWYHTLYIKDESLSPHIDGHKREAGFRSIYTILLYLNMSPDFEGGDTHIMDKCIDTFITPKTGKAIILSQDILHEGCKILSGTKYIIRGDIMMRSF